MSSLQSPGGPSRVYTMEYKNNRNVQCINWYCPSDLSAESKVYMLKMQVCKLGFLKKWVVVKTCCRDLYLIVRIQCIIQNS